MTHLPLVITESDHRRLVSWVRAGTTPQRVTRRARIVLLSAEGKSVRVIAQTLRISERTVLLWRQRYREHGAEGLRRDAPGRGRKPSLPPDSKARIRALLATKPPEGSRWTVRRIAEATSLSRASVHRILRAISV